MDRLTFNICIFVFLAICDYITWLFVEQGENPLAVLIGIQFITWLIANAFFDADR